MTQPTAPPARVVVTYRPYRDENGAQHNHATASPALVSSCRPVPRCVLRACCVRCTPCTFPSPRSSAPRLARRLRRLGTRDGADRLRALRAVLDLHVPLLHQQLAQPVLPGARAPSRPRTRAACSLWLTHPGRSTARPPLGPAAAAAAAAATAAATTITATASAVAATHTHTHTLNHHEPSHKKQNNPLASSNSIDRLFLFRPPLLFNGMISHRDDDV